MRWFGSGTRSPVERAAPAGSKDEQATAATKAVRQARGARSMEEAHADDEHGDHGQKDVRPERPAVIHGVAAHREEDRRQAREKEGDARTGWRRA